MCTNVHLRLSLILTKQFQENCGLIEIYLFQQKLRVLAKVAETLNFEPGKAKKRNFTITLIKQNWIAQSAVKRIIAIKIVAADLALIGTKGIVRIFDWGGANHKKHAMTSSEIFEKGTFCGAKIS